MVAHLHHIYASLLPRKTSPVFPRFFLSRAGRRILFLLCSQFLASLGMESPESHGLM